MKPVAQVDVVINSRSYRIACDEGQDEHLKKLASYVDNRMQGLISDVGQVGDTRLLVMVSLLIADELSETLNVLDKEEDVSEKSPTVDNFAQTMENLAKRIEVIAAQLEAA